MSECVILINIYIYICLFHFVANEEKLLLRYNGGELEWEFTLDIGTKGGQELYNRLNEKKIEITFEIYNLFLLSYFNENFPSFYKTDLPRGCRFTNGDMLGFKSVISIETDSGSANNAEIIGHVNNFSNNELKSLVGNSQFVNLELVLESDEIKKPDTTKEEQSEKPDTTKEEEIEKPDKSKIAEINKKIIKITIIGLSILIILIIIKFIV